MAQAGQGWSVGWYDYQLNKDGDPVADAAPPYPAWLRALLGDQFFGDVVAARAIINDASLAYVKDLPRLRDLDLRGSVVTDEGLQHLRGLNDLEKLDLSFTPITDKGLGRLKHLTKLRSLSLISTEISDAGLKRSKGTHLFVLTAAGWEVSVRRCLVQPDRLLAVSCTTR
jgi:hypothetical protein